MKDLDLLKVNDKDNWRAFMDFVLVSFSLTLDRCLLSGDLKFEMAVLNELFGKLKKTNVDRILFYRQSRKNWPPVNNL